MGWDRLRVVPLWLAGVWFALATAVASGLVIAGCADRDGRPIGSARSRSSTHSPANSSVHGARTAVFGRARRGHSVTPRAKRRSPPRPALQGEQASTGASGPSQRPRSTRALLRYSGTGSRNLGDLKIPGRRCSPSVDGPCPACLLFASPAAAFRLRASSWLAS